MPSRPFFIICCMTADFSALDSPPYPNWVRSPQGAMGMIMMDMLMEMLPMMYPGGLSKAEKVVQRARDLARLDAEPPVLHHLLHDGGLLRLG
jgi:hypothetical protein